MVRTYLGPDGIFQQHMDHHAEIIAVSRLLNEHPSLALSDVAVSSACEPGKKPPAWTNAAPATRTAGSAALTCPNCRGVLGESGIVVATDNIS